MEEEYRTSSNLHWYINIVDSRVPCAPPTIQCRYGSGIHYFDRAIENFYIGLAQELMADRLVSKVRVKRKIIGFVTYIYKQHHGISADILERKWEIGSDKENIEGIVKAMRNIDGYYYGGSCSYHWYQCPNGHSYFIEHCGQAMEESTCTECGEKVGGGHHQLLEKNQSAAGIVHEVLTRW